MIQPNQNDGLLSAGEAFSSIVTQQHLNECRLALGRDLQPFEFKCLEEVMLMQQGANAQLMMSGQKNAGHSLDQVLEVFCERVKRQERLAEKAMRKRRRI